MFAVRVAEAADADAICDVHVAAWRAAHRGIVPDHLLDAPRFERDQRARWRSWRLPPDSEVVVVTDDGHVVGFAALGPEREPDDPLGMPRGELYAFYVHPDAWGTGAADVLMDQAEHRLVARGDTMGVLWVLADNPRARRFYERRGWRWTGESAWYERVGDELVETVEYTHRLDAPC